MQITIDDKIVRNEIKFYIEGQIFNMYDPADLKKAKVPSKTALTAALMEDQEFQKEISKFLAEQLKTAISDAIEESPSKILVNLFKTLDAIRN